jgi:hypothetical protein
MSKDQKLSAPAFSKEDGGVEISASGDQLRSSLIVRRTVRYEQIIIDTNFQRIAKRFVSFAGGLFRHFLGGNSAARSPLSAQYKNQMKPFKDAITTKREGYGVANISDNKMVAGTSVFKSQQAAQEYVDQAISQNPALSGSVHVVPEFEIRRAA